MFATSMWYINLNKPKLNQQMCQIHNNPNGTHLLKSSPYSKSPKKTSSAVRTRTFSLKTRCCPREASRSITSTQPVFESMFVVFTAQIGLSKEATLALF